MYICIYIYIYIHCLAWSAHSGDDNLTIIDKPSAVELESSKKS